MVNSSVKSQSVEEADAFSNHTSFCKCLDLAKLVNQYSSGCKGLFFPSAHYTEKWHIFVCFVVESTIKHSGV